MGGRCRMNFSQDLLKAAEKLVAGSTQVQVEPRSCLDQCEKGPNVELVELGKDPGEIRHGLTPGELTKMLTPLLGEPREKGASDSWLNPF